MIALYIVIAGACCLVAGFLIGFFLRPQKKGVQGAVSVPEREFLEKESEQLKGDLEKKEQEALSLRASLEDLRSEKEDLAQKNSALSEKCSSLEERVGELKEDLSKSEADFKEQLRSQEAKNKEAEERLRSSIEDEFEKSRQAQKDAEGRQAGENRKREDKQIEILKCLEPLKDDISALRSKLGDIEEGRKDEIGQLKASIEDLRRAEQSISEEAKSFSSLLSNNQLRGRWGEVQLENLVEKCGMEEHVDFDIQLTLPGEEKNGRPDLVVMFPGHGAMPVDAKTPLEDFEEVEKGQKDKSAYSKVVRGHVDALAKRNYPKLLMKSGYDPTSFTVAYIPCGLLAPGSSGRRPRPVGVRLLQGSGPLLLCEFLGALAVGEGFLEELGSRRGGPGNKRFGIGTFGEPEKVLPIHLRSRIGPPKSPQELQLSGGQCRFQGGSQGQEAMR